MEALWSLACTRSARWGLVDWAGGACEVERVPLTELGALEGCSSLQMLATFSGTMDSIVYIHQCRMLHVVVEGLASISRSIGDLHRPCEGSAIRLAQRLLL